ncbi:MAG: UDP-N-acetyl glucosamine 2-epimerase [bacterium]|nr:UDP-N-acetyl glucosamine 2-epimerase [bacterium]
MTGASTTGIEVLQGQDGPITNEGKIWLDGASSTGFEVGEDGSVNGILNESVSSRLILAEPVSYTDMIALESNARVIVTDSGGVQKEGYFFDTPCVVAREQTEWVELTEAGWTKLTGADADKIIASTDTFWEKRLKKGNETIFGNGNASDKIANILGKA